MKNRDIRPIPLALVGPTDVRTLHKGLLLNDYRVSARFARLIQERTAGPEATELLGDMFLAMCEGCDVELLSPEITMQVFLLCARKIRAGNTGAKAQRYATELWQMVARIDAGDDAIYRAKLVSDLIM